MELRQAQSDGVGLVLRLLHHVQSVLVQGNLPILPRVGHHAPEVIERISKVGRGMNQGVHPLVHPLEGENIP